MEDDFEARFKDIMNNNDFSGIPEPPEENSISLDEIAETLASINATSQHLADMILGFIQHNMNHFPAKLLNVFRAMHLLADEFNMTIQDEDDYICEECEAEMDEEEDDE
jgi:hypothetical protein